MVGRRKESLEIKGLDGNALKIEQFFGENNEKFNK